MHNLTTSDITVKLPDDSQWTYSHSQLSLFRICPARYAGRYVYGIPSEEKTPVMEFSKALIHKPVEDLHVQGLLEEQFVNDMSNEYWTGRMAEFEQATLVKDHPVFNLDVARQCFREYLVNRLESIGLIHVEQSRTVTIADRWQYVSIPDFLTDACTADIKFSTSSRHYVLKPFDDQFLGQAIVYGRPAFRRYQFRVSPKGKFLGMYVEEHPVDPIHADRWVIQTVKTIQDIERCRITGIWPMHDHACMMWNRQCEYYADCTFGRI